MPTAVKTPRLNVPDIVALPFETLKLPLETVRAPVLNVPVRDEFPDIVAPPLETVKAPVLNDLVIDELPVILNPPYETVNGLLHVNPLQVTGAVGSIEIPHFPKLIPESCTVIKIGDIAK